MERQREQGQEMEMVREENKREAERRTLQGQCREKKEGSRRREMHSGTHNRKKNTHTYTHAHAL